MIELRLTLDGIDYEELLPLLVPAIIKKPVAAKATVIGAKAFLKTKTQSERDAFAAKILLDHKERIIASLNAKLEKKGIKGKIKDIDTKAL